MSGAWPASALRAARGDTNKSRPAPSGGTSGGAGIKPSAPRRQRWPLEPRAWHQRQGRTQAVQPNRQPNRPPPATTEGRPKPQWEHLRPVFPKTQPPGAPAANPTTPSDGRDMPSWHCAQAAVQDVPSPQSKFSKACSWLYYKCGGHPLRDVNFLVRREPTQIGLNNPRSRPAAAAMPAGRRRHQRRSSACCLPAWTLACMLRCAVRSKALKSATEIQIGKRK